MLAGAVGIEVVAEASSAAEAVAAARAHKPDVVLMDLRILTDLWDELVSPQAVRSAWALLVAPSGRAG